MKATELIKKLQETVDRIGDVNVIVAVEKTKGFTEYEIGDYSVVADKEKGKQIWIEI
jgi:hypothetical protein